MGIESRSKSGPVDRSNLPIPLTSFIGREQELLRIKQLLADTRLLTLTGAGGSGKTRLALQVAAEMCIDESATDGVWWVELASLTNPDLVPQSVASALGVREIPNKSSTEILLNYLQAKDLLLVLDNCEHLVSATAQFCELLLSACPQLKILTTSREALAIGAEQVLVVPPLTLPPSHQTSTTQTLMEFEAIRLFLERARASNPEFSLTATSAPAVLQVCRRLDGLPLAIELAAARVKVLTVEQIAARLDDRLHLLTTGSRTALPRHQTLRATLEWSYGLLTEQEKCLFRRLSVFAGGWTLEQAEGICSGDGIESREVLDLLSHLVEKSLVTRQEQSGAARYHFLETIRSYAHTKLLDSPDMKMAQQRHLDFFLKLAEETHHWNYGEPLHGERSRQERYRVELENVRAALSWSLDGAETEKGVRLAAALQWFWHLNGYLKEGVEWLRRALLVSSRVSPQARAKALLVASEANQFRGNYKEAITLAEESIALYRELGDKSNLTDALRGLSDALRTQGNQERAIAVNDERMQLFRELGNEMGVAGCLVTLAWSRQMQGDFEASVPLLEESLSVYRKRQNENAITLALGMLARVYRARGDFAQATLIYNQVMANSWKTGHTVRLTFGLEFYAVLATLQKQAERAARLWGAAHGLRESSGIARPAAQKDYAEYERDARSQLDGETFAQLYAEGKAMPLEQAVEYAMAAPIPAMVPDRDPSAPLDDTAAQKYGGLTGREGQVAQLVAQGLSNREIATQLVVSERTVETHVGNILSKLNFHSRTQIGVWVLKIDERKNQA